jgi:hypothetical protein
VRTVHEAQHVGAGAGAAASNRVVGSGSDVVGATVVLDATVVAGALVVGCPIVVVGSAAVVVDASGIVVLEVDVVVVDVVVVGEVVVVVESDDVVVVGSSGPVPACAGRAGERPIRPVNTIASVSPPNDRAGESLPPNMGTGGYYSVRLDRRRGTGSMRTNDGGSVRRRRCVLRLLVGPMSGRFVQVQIRWSHGVMW